MSRRAHRADAVRRPGRAPRGVRPPDRADAGRRGARADHPRAGRDQGRGERPLRRDPLGPAAPCRGRAVARGRDRGGLRGRRSRCGPDRDGRAAHLHGAALARPGRERRRSPRPRSASAIRVSPAGTSPGPEAAFPIRCHHAARVRGRTRGRPADHAPRRGVGRRGPGAARAGRWTPSGSPTAPAPSTTRRCAPSSRAAASRWTCAPPRTGRRAPCRRSRRTRSPGSTGTGVPVTLNTDDTTVSDITLSEEYVNAVEADRADAAGAVGDRPARARRRVRRRGDARADPRRVRRLGREHPRPARRRRRRGERIRGRRATPAHATFRGCTAPPAGRDNERRSQVLPRMRHQARRRVPERAGRPTQPGARFCGECGVRLLSDEAAATAARPPVADLGRGRAGSPAVPAAPVAERRLVTVLFADLVGFTPFAEGRDAEAGPRAADAATSSCARDVIERYGGTVEKFIGDAVMAVWGAPIAHEDDAERAVRAALELVRRRPAASARAPGSRRRADRRGRGHPRRQRDQGMVAGDLVNTASRLQSVAAPGTVLVGEATQRAASRAHRVRAGRRAVAQGQGRAGAGLARAARRRRARRPRSGDRLEAPFVGRDDELRLLKDLFHATAREATRPARLDHRHRPASARAASLGAPEVRRRRRRGRLVARRPIARVRRGHHLLGARRDGPRALPAGRDRRRRDDPRARSPRRVAELRPRRGGAALDRAAPCWPCSASARHRPVAATSCSRAWRTFFERIADRAPWCSSSRTSTGPTRACSTSSTTCSSGAAASRS